jgi:hypothetical protein
MKPHREFFALDLENGWDTPAGYPAGFKHKILSSDLDEKNKSGHRSRLMKIEPGAYTTTPFVHDHWEEVFLFQGDMVCGNDAEGKGGELFQAPTYAVRPPGIYHGPFTTKTGCIMFELHYYDKDSRPTVEVGS